MRTALGHQPAMPNPAAWTPHGGQALPSAAMTERLERPILVVDDDAKIRRLLRTYLEREGWPVLEAADGTGALASISLHEPALVVLDVMLPEVDGLAVIRALRRTARTPVIVLSARGTTADRIAGLGVGADDYLPKPFSPAELVLRVRRLLERAAPAAAPPVAPAVLGHGELMLDTARHSVTLADRPVPVTAVEFRLLAALLRADGRVLTRDQLLDAVYGPDDEAVLDRTIDVHVGRLRRKLGDEAERPRFIATVRGVGYRMAGLGSKGPLRAAGPRRP
jgi:DNA-binding response OmpR family regulator